MKLSKPYRLPLFLLIVLITFIGCSEEKKEKQIKPEPQPTAEQRFHQKISQLEETFTDREGRVIRERESVIIRLTGLKFGVGGSEIKPENADLLAKVRDAIYLFPDAKLAISGHTDAVGSAAANMKLSRDRAEAFKTYLVDKMGIDPSRIIAVGFGETQPIASNETAEGRAQNRRIDITIYPHLSSK